MDLITPEYEEIQDEVESMRDPYINLSFGVKSYFQFLEQLIKFCLLMTLLSCPLYLMYSNEERF